MKLDVTLVKSTGVTIEVPDDFDPLDPKCDAEFQKLVAAKDAEGLSYEGPLVTNVMSPDFSGDPEDLLGLCDE